MTFDPSGLTAYVNGEYVDATKASVSIFDHGFLYGDGVFEGMRVFDGGLFRANLHMDRIERSARTIGLPMPVAQGRSCSRSSARSCGAPSCRTPTCARSSPAASAAPASTRATAPSRR